MAFRTAGAIIILHFIKNDLAGVGSKQRAGLASEDLVLNYDWPRRRARDFDREFLPGFTLVAASSALVFDEEIPAAVFDRQVHPVAARRIALKLDDNPR